MLYARQAARVIHVGKWVDDYAVKGSMLVDIAINDIAKTKLGTVNLIVGQCYSEGRGSGRPSTGRSALRADYSAF